MGYLYQSSTSIADCTDFTFSGWIKGKASDASFYTNAGNGGSFTKVGTISDFTPTPSY